MKVSKELFSRKLHTLDWAFISSFINMTDTFCLMGCEETAIPASISEDTNYELNDLKELVGKYINGKYKGTEEEYIIEIRENIHWLLNRIARQLEI